MKGIIILASIISNNFSFCCYYIETLSKVARLAKTELTVTTSEGIMGEYQLT